MLGMSLPAFTLLHVLISLVGIATGLVWLLAYIKGTWRPVWAIAFLLTTIATSATGFLFTTPTFSPAKVVGVISLVVLAVALVVVVFVGLRGRWRALFLVTATMGLYLNLFVLVVQAFQKLPPLHALAPKGGEPPFAVVQGALLIAMIALGFLAVRRGKAWPL
jgi:hypothetical protein